MAACCAAKGVPLRDPRKPREPELFQESTRPSRSQMVTRVLLNDAWMCTTAWGTCLRSFFLNCFFLPFFSGAAGAPAAGGGFVSVNHKYVLNPPRLASTTAEAARAPPNTHIHVLGRLSFFLTTLHLTPPRPIETA